MDKTYVGIDVSKDRLDVHVRPAGESFVVTRDGAGLGALVERLRGYSAEQIAVEATGGFETVVVGELAAAGLPVVMVNPARVRAFARSIGKLAKTDPIDAATIARYAEVAKLELRPLPDAATQQLADLVARRRQIVQMMAAERQREKRASVRMRKSIARLLKALEKELSSLEQDLDDNVRGSPIWREKEDLLASVPGVGQTTARTLLADLPELGSLSRRTIAALAGIAPWTQRSGKWEGKAFISGGRPTVRTALYMAAMTASRHNPQLAAFYKRLLNKGKAKKLALVAVARKLLTILNALLRDRRPWQNA